MTAIISNTELQAISDYFTPGFLTDVCSIQRKDGGGLTYAEVATSPCAIVGPGMDEKDVSNETTGAVLKRVLFPRNTDVRSPDLLVINAIPYRVFDLKDPSTYEVFRRVTVTRFPQRGGA